MALVLTRRHGEMICIGDHITVTVIGVSQRGEVRLAIDAPREIAVHREEVKRRIEEEGAAADRANS